jgi:23S rRNA pseudouridine1911/1915/1917 synthase
VRVPPYAGHQRLDAFLTRAVGGRSRSEWQRLIGLSAVTLDGRRVKPSDRVAPGQRVEIRAVPAHVVLRPAADIPLTVVYEDPAMIVIDKPAGLVVHPAPGHEEGTLVNALLARFPELRDPTGEQRPGIVHRLDKDTSGLMVIGRTAPAMAALQAQFRQRTATKRYLLLVRGDLRDEVAAIEAPIGRDRRDRKRMAAQAAGRESRTEFRVVERFGDYTLVEATLLSGRTHQLRVHFRFIGHPVAGDATYGSAKGPPGLKRQFVHAAYLKIRSPHDGEDHEFHAPLPPDLSEPLERLRAGRLRASNGPQPDEDATTPPPALASAERSGAGGRGRR